MIASTTQLNAVGRSLPDLPGIQRVTDVTGFGLLGHALELARGSRLAATVRLADVPLLPDVGALAARGVGTGAAGRNWASYGTDVELPPDLPEWRRALVCDPQTSGGLLIACAVEAVPGLLDRLRSEGFTRAAEIGRLSNDGAPCIRVTA